MRSNAHLRDSIVESRSDAHFLDRRNFHHEAMPCFLEVLDRVALSRHFLRRVPLLSAAMEGSALQTKPQIPR